MAEENGALGVPSRVGATQNQNRIAVLMPVLLLNGKREDLVEVFLGPSIQPRSHHFRCGFWEEGLVRLFTHLPSLVRLTGGISTVCLSF